MPDPNPAPANPASPVNPDPAAPANPVAAANPNPASANPDPAAAANPAANPAAPAAATTWPEDWRKVYAGEDAKKLARLERFTDPAKAFDALIEAQNKIRTGDLAKPLPANATEEQVKEWRAANGIPEKPDGYFEKLPNGLVIGADDKPMFDEVAQRLHKLNAPPAVVHELTQWYYGLADAETAKVEETDKVQARETTDALRQAWGNDYRANIGQVTSLLDGLGPELKAQFMDATLADGRRLFNAPDVVKWFAGLAREINPAGVLIPNSGEGSMQSIETELAKLRGLMGDSRSEYHKGPNAEKNQERYRQLIEAQQKLKARAA